MREAARARGFEILEPSAITDGRKAARLLPLMTSNVKGGARVRADLGSHAQAIATAAARALGVPVTLLQVSGTATGVRGRLTITLAPRAMQIDRAGKAHVLRVEVEDTDYEQDDDLDWSEPGELLRAGYDLAGNVLAEAAQRLDLSLENEGERIVHTLLRPTAAPRVAEIGALIAISGGHELVKQPDGRVLVKIALEGGKRMAYLSATEAEELQQLLAR